MKVTRYRKISVVGNSAAGKSTLSYKLGMELGIKVFSVDKIFWQAGWSLRDKASFKKLHDEWLEQDSWIIEGIGYWHEMEQRITESDLVIFLDVPVMLCKERAKSRIKEEELVPNAFITAGCLYNDVKDLQRQVIDNFHNELRPKLIKYISGLRPEKIRVITSVDEQIL